MMESGADSGSGSFAASGWRRVKDFIGPRVWPVVLLNGGLCVLFAAAGILFRGDPNKLFGEGKPGTLLSVLMLALSSFGSFRRAIGALPRQVRVGWLIFGLSLALAAADDMFKGHEKLDEAINSLLGLDPDGFADKLDDVLVLLYAVPAVFVTFWVWRRYLFSMPATLWRFAVAGAFFAGMLAFDALGQLESLEESLKIMSGSFIFAAVAGTPKD